MADRNRENVGEHAVQNENLKQIAEFLREGHKRYANRLIAKARNFYVKSGASL